MKIAFRVVASTQIGAGHVMRCLTLANQLVSLGHRCWFLSREHPGNLNDLISSNGHYLLRLEAHESDTNLASVAAGEYAHRLGASWQEDVRQTIDAILPVKPDCLVVDHYALDARWEQGVSSVVGEIFVVDDLANRPHVCSVLLDQNLGRVPSDYNSFLPPESQRLIGPKFALLRPEFAVARKVSLERRKNVALRRILVSMGGVDQHNITSRVLDLLKVSQLPADTELDIVVGATSPHLEDICNRADDLSYKTTVSVNVKNMAERMCQADLSIGAAGGTSWERACLGLPAIVFVLEANQYAIAGALEVAGAAIVINGNEKEMPKIIAEILKFGRLKQLSESARKITDGYGALRVARAVEVLGS